MKKDILIVVILSVREKRGEAKSYRRGKEGDEWGGYPLKGARSARRRPAPKWGGVSLKGGKR